MVCLQSVLNISYRSMGIPIFIGAGELKMMIFLTGGLQNFVDRKILLNLFSNLISYIIFTYLRTSH